MRKRAHIYKNVSIMLAIGLIASNIPLNVYAQNNKMDVKKTEIVTEKEVETDVYNQNYDAPEGITWKNLNDKGTLSVSEGFLNVTNNGDYRFLENESKSLEDGQLESRFQVDSSGRFGILFRATENNYAGVAYDVDGNWEIFSKDKWKTIKGPKLEAGDWVTLNVMFRGNNVTININGEEYFNEAVDFLPIQSGKLGYRSWYNSKTTKVDYIKYGPIGSIGDGEAPEMNIESIEDVNVETFVKLKPSLPSRVKVKYDNGATGNANVTWDNIDKSLYTKPGEFTVEGKVQGTDIKAIANVTVRGEGISYAPDYTKEENQGWEVTQGGGDVVYEGNSAKVRMNGKSIAFDEKSPNLKNFAYEADFKTSTNDGRIGLMFRYTSNDDWASICYDNGGWIWKAYNKGQESYGKFGGSSIKLEANTNYRMKLKVQDNNVSLWVDDELVGSQSLGSLPNQAGKIGLHGWFGNKDVTVGNIKLEEILPLLPPDVGETQEQVISSDKMNVVLDNNYPRVIRYEWKEDGSTLVGEDEQLYIMEVNNEKYVPEVTCTTKNNKSTYELKVKEIGVEVTLEMSVNNNKLRMEVTKIKESGDTKVKTINFPNHSLASVTSEENGKTASVLTTGDWNNIIEEFKNVKDLDAGSKGKTYGFINNDEFAVTINNNVIEGGNRVVLSTESRNGHKKTGIGNGTWIYREELSMPKEELPWSEVMITKDSNKDNKVDWQDAAIQYRNNMRIPKGGEDIKNNMSYIDFNIGYTQNPFLRSLDMVKKISNYTDNFGQLILHKGYQGEGHDDSHPDYGGHIGIRQGGVEDFNTLINEGKKYNAKIGVHINATEYARDAFELKPELINENVPGWAWMDKTFYADQRKDITSGELYRRLDMLKKDAPDLGWVYVDVYTGNGWNAHKLAQKIDELDYMFATEMNGPLEQDVVWTHWGGDPAYPNKGNASKIMRFMKNGTQDTFLADPLLKGNKHLLSGGWGNRHDVEGEYAMDVFYNQVLPTKYLQHFDIMTMTDDEVSFENGVRAVYEGNDINYYREDRLVATTPKDSIGETGIGKTQLFLPWNPVEEDEKIYHWNPLGTGSEWELPDSWKNLKTVKLYELSDLGKTLVKDVKVKDGKVKLDVEKNTPYLVMKGKVKEERISDWGYGSEIKDPGFDSQTWNVWKKDSSAKNTDHIQIINEKTSRRNGNDLVKISGNNGKDAEISQEIKGLEKGATYSASVWVKNEGNRDIKLEVSSGKDKVETKSNKVYQKRAGEGVKFGDDKFTRMEVEFTANDNGKAKVDLKVGNGAKDSEVFVDDFRIWEHPGHTNKDGYVFYEDFENVDEGITPFFLAEKRGTSNRSHLAERDLLGRQYKHWVLDGRFSLKTNQQPGEAGEMLVTEDSTFKLEPNKTYELGFLYSLADARAGYTVNVKSKSKGLLVSIDLDKTDVTGKNLTNAKELNKTFTTGNTDDYYISIDKKSHSGDIVELIVDNIYVKEIKNVKKEALSYVNLNTMVNNLEVGQEIEFYTNALMNTGESVDLKDCEVDYKISNPKTLSIKDGKMIAKKKGTSQVFVKVKYKNNVVMSNKVDINVK